MKMMMSRSAKLKYKKEIKILPHVEKLQNDLEGNEIIEFIEMSDLYFTIIITPTKNSKWSDGVFEFRVNFNNENDTLPDSITSEEYIFHPNIGDDFSVSDKALKQDWNASFDLYKVLTNFYENFFEKDELNLESPTNKYAAELYKKDINEFYKKVRDSIQG